MARRCCAPARAPATTCSHGTLGDARLALEAFRGHVSLEAADFEIAARPWSDRSHGLRSAWRCVGLRPARSMSRTACSASRHILRRSAVGATVDVDALPAGRALAHQPAPGAASTRWPAATTTSWCSARRPHRPMPCAGRRSERRRRDSHRAHRVRCRLAAGRCARRRRCRPLRVVRSLQDMTRPQR